MTAEEYTEEIKQICQELSEAAEEIAQKERVTHLSQSAIQFHSGILGAIQGSRESSRLKKLMNGPFYKEWSFFQFAFHITEECKRMVDMQMEVQDLVSSDNPMYYDNTFLIARTIKSISWAWYNYSPDMANESLVINGEEGVALKPTVDGWTKDSIALLDLPPELQWYKKEDKPVQSSGCLGVFIFLLGLSGGLLYWLIG
jgi:hypothetical protein